MVGGQGDELRLAFDQDAQGQPLRHPQRTALHLVHVGDVEPAVGEHAQQRVRGDVHLQDRLPLPRAQPPQPAREGAARGGADPELGAVVVRRGGPRLRDQGAHFGHQRAGAAQDDTAERGRPAAGAFAEEERAAELLLDALELGAQRGLGHAELPGRPVQAAGVGDGAQCAEVPHLELHAVSLGRPHQPHQTHKPQPKGASWVGSDR